MPAGGQIFLQQVAGADADEAGVGAVGAGEPFGVGDGAVHHQVHSGGGGGGSGRGG